MRSLLPNIALPFDAVLFGPFVNSLFFFLLVFAFFFFLLNIFFLLNTPISPKTILLHLNKGFTLIELLVVIAIIAVLAVIGFAVFGGITGKSNDDRRAGDIKAFADAMALVRTRANASVYTAPTVNDFSGGVFPKEPTSRTEKYCYADSASAPITNMAVNTTQACSTGYVSVDGIAPTVVAGAQYFKFCTMNDVSNSTRAVICRGSRY